MVLYLYSAYFSSHTIFPLIKGEHSDCITITFPWFTRDCSDVILCKDVHMPHRMCRGQQAAFVVSSHLPSCSIWVSPTVCHCVKYLSKSGPLASAMTPAQDSHTWRCLQPYHPERAWLCLILEEMIQGSGSGFSGICSTWKFCGWASQS